MTFVDDVQVRLRTAGAEIQVPPGSQARVVAAGRTRRRHRRAFLTTSSALVVVAVTVLALAHPWRDSPGGVASVDDPTSQPDVSQPGGGVGSTADLIGKQAPAIHGTAVDGSVIDLADYRGKWVILNVSATWCEPCQQGLGTLVAATQKRADVQVLTLAYDDDPGAVTSALTAAGVTWPVLAADPAGTDYKITGVPNTIVIGPDGTVRGVVNGGPWTPSALDPLLG